MKSLHNFLVQHHIKHYTSYNSNIHSINDIQPGDWFVTYDKYNKWIEHIIILNPKQKFKINNRGEIKTYITFETKKCYDKLSASQAQVYINDTFGITDDNLHPDKVRSLTDEEYQWAVQMKDLIDAKNITGKDKLLFTYTDDNKIQLI